MIGYRARRFGCAGLAALLAVALATCAVGREFPRSSAVAVDHHVHLNSPAIQAFLPDFCRSVARFGKCDPALTTPRAPQDLLRAMDQAGVRRALVFSTGYLAESPMVTPSRPDAADVMRAANDWTVDLARRHRGRLRAFVSVDPLRPSALPEIARCRAIATSPG